MYKLKLNVNLGLLCCVVLLTVACSKDADKVNSLSKPAAKEVVSSTTQLDDISSHKSTDSAKSATAHIEHSIDEVVKNVTSIEFNRLGTGLFYAEEINGNYRIVLNGKPDKPYTNLMTPVLSPDGQRIAYQAYIDDTVRMVIDGREGEVVDELDIPFFSPDSRHVVYQAKYDGKWHFVVDGVPYTSLPVEHKQLGFNADSTKIAYVNKADEQSKPRLVITDLKFKKQVVREATGSEMVISEDRTKIAAICESGDQKRVVETSFATPDIIKEGALYPHISNLTISTDGTSVAYRAVKNNQQLVVFNGKEKLYPGGDLLGSLVIRPDKKGLGFLTTVSGRSSFQQLFFNDSTLDNAYDEVGELVYSNDSSKYAFLARKEVKGKTGSSIFTVINGREGSRFDKLLRPVFSPDGMHLVYRVRHKGKRFLVVSDTVGSVTKRHPDYELVFEPVFTADGKSVAYGVKDGNKLIWKVEKL